MKYSSFKPSHFTVPQNYVEKIEPKGVDLSSPAMEADKDRAVYSINYRYNGSKAEKRWGYRKVGYVPETPKQANPHNPILGMWSFIGSTGIKVNVAITARGFYEARFEGDRWSFLEIDQGEYKSFIVPEAIRQESGTVVGNLLYILTGKKMLVVYENDNGLFVDDISGREAYIPTTLVNGLPDNVINMPESGGSFSYESINSLTPFVKNTFLSGMKIDGNGYFESNWPSFQIPYRIDGRKASNIEVEIESIGILAAVYRNGAIDFDKALDSSITTIHATIDKSWPDDCMDSANENESLNIYNIVSQGAVDFMLIDEENATHLQMSQGYDHKTLVDCEEKTFYGANGVTTTYLVPYIYIWDGGGHKKCRLLGYGSYGTDNRTASFVLFNNYIPPVEGQGNIKFQYPIFNAPESEVTKCRYFQRFGHNNALNRVWAYGNPDKPNYAYVTREPAEEDYINKTIVHSAQEDFTYFPEDGFHKFGEPNSVIAGMEIVSENKMAVIKTRGGSSPTMYFVQPTMVERTIGELSYEQEEYSTFPSNTSTASLCPTPSGNTNLNGDILFFSNDRQLVGLDIEGITGDSRRAAYTRSYYIDRELKDLNPESINLFSFGNYIILDSDTKTYCANLSQFNADTKQYEWWPIDNIHARCFFEDDDGRVFFTDDKGGIYQLDGHTDIERFFVDEATGDLFSLTQTGNLVISDQMGEELYEIQESGIQIEVDIPNGFTSDLYYDEDDGSLSLAKSGIFGYWSDNGTSRIALKVKYSSVKDYLPYGATILANHGGDPDEYTLAEAENEPSASFDYARFYQNEYDGDIFYDNSSLDLKLSGRHKVIVIKEPPNSDYKYSLRLADPHLEFTSVEYPIEIFYEKPIKALWWSRPVPTAKFSYDKTIKQIDLYNDTRDRSELMVGCITNKQLHTYEANKAIDVGMEFDFSQVNFEELDFNKRLVPTIYHMKRFPKRQQYFSLVQKSDTKENSALSDMDITYTLQGVAKTKR